jgi:hypothetical protein
MVDSLGDLHMAKGIPIPNPNVILKIGFLNRNTQENLIKYRICPTFGHIFDFT